MKTMMMLLMAAVAVTGCTSSDNTISGSWRVGGDNGCQDSFAYGDTVDVTITAATGGVVAKTSLACGDGGFAIGIPVGVEAAHVELHAYAIGDSGEHLETGTARVDLTGIDGDRDIGAQHFTFAQ